MFAALSILRSPIGAALLGAVALGLFTTFIWVRATNVANDAWQVKQAAAVELARQQDETRNDAIIGELRAQVNHEQQARRSAEAASEEMRNAFANDTSDTTVRVGPGVERVFDRVFNTGADETS